LKNVYVEDVTGRTVRNLKVEMVERKGLGHPDTICDAVAEGVSRALSKEYLARFGQILHHNTDKALLVAGEARPKFGGGEVIKPIKIIQAGRATVRIGSDVVPVDEIARKAMVDHLRNNLRNIDLNLHVDLETFIGQGSVDLQDLFARKGHYPGANDTSFGCGFAPFSDTEKVVLETEKFLNSDAYKKKHPGVGEDIKVMGLRRNGKISVTIACAMVDKYLQHIDDYRALKEGVIDDLKDLYVKLTSEEVNIFLNTADDYDRGSVYITVTGTSGEAGDDGSVGRGNRVNGLITPNRTMSLEAAAGKNPVSHVGKIYNVLANRIAEDVVEGVKGIAGCEVKILSQIGKPINEPQALQLSLDLEHGVSLRTVEQKARYISEQWLDDVNVVTHDIIEAKALTH
jgi:S-adenosylmethionine synthetase